MQIGAITTNRKNMESYQETLAFAHVLFFLFHIFNPIYKVLSTTLESTLECSMFDIIVVLWSWYMIRVVLYYHYIAQYFKWTNQTHTHTKSAAQPVPPGGAPFVINFVDRKCSQWHPSLFRTLNLFLELIGKLIFLITLNTHAQQEGLYCLLFCTCWLLNLSSAVKAFNSSPALHKLVFLLSFNGRRLRFVKGRWPVTFFI